MNRADRGRKGKRKRGKQGENQGREEGERREKNREQKGGSEQRQGGDEPKPTPLRLRVLGNQVQAKGSVFNSGTCGTRQPAASLLCHRFLPKLTCCSRACHHMDMSLPWSRRQSMLCSQRSSPGKYFWECSREPETHLHGPVRSKGKSANSRNIPLAEANETMKHGEG